MVSCLDASCSLAQLLAGTNDIPRQNAYFSDVDQTFRAPGSLPGPSVVDGALFLLLALLSGRGLMLLIMLHSGLFGAVCVALFPPLQRALGVSCCRWLIKAPYYASLQATDVIGRGHCDLIRLLYVDLEAPHLF